MWRYSPHSARLSGVWPLGRDTRLLEIRAAEAAASSVDIHPLRVSDRLLHALRVLALMSRVVQLQAAVAALIGRHSLDGGDGEWAVSVLVS